MKWEDPPGRVGRGDKPQVDHYALASQLRARPTEWARILKYERASVSGATARVIRMGLTKAWQPEGAFEARARTVNGVHWVYARYIGESDV